MRNKRIRDLLIDLGNSRLKWAMQTNGQLEVAVPIEPVEGEYRNMHALFAAAQMADGVWICTTAGAAANALQAQLTPFFEQPMQRFVSPSSGLGLVNGYTQADRLGSDRYLAMAAARAHQSGAFLLADAGTALTLDLVDSGGQHLGGQIIPGPILMRDSLHRGTAGVRSNTDAQVHRFARNTTDAVWSGAVLACAAAIDASLRQAETILGTRVSLLICGGAASLLLPHLALPTRHCPDLVLEGLALWAAEQG